MIRRPPSSPLFPSTPFSRSREQRLAALSPDGVLARGYSITLDAESGTVIRSAAATKVNRRVRIRLASGRIGARVEEVETDRKSTRLNSSHSQISYAGFCLKK